MSRRSARLAPALLLAGCLLSPIDRDGRQCDELDQCVAGYACEPATHLCVPVGSQTCTPSCHPLIEHCTAEGCALNDYVPGSRRPAMREPVSFVLPPSIIDTGAIELDFDALPASFDRVDVEALDVLLVPPRPGGEPYGVCRFDDLPVRPPDHPLVIASTSGPVQCVAGIFSGGSNWVLSGRDDALSGIGDPSAPGHALGYANTAGRYGFEFLSFVMVSLLPEVSQPAFEIEFVELSGRVGTAGPSLYVQGTTSDASNVLLHDLYIHDADLGGGVTLQVSSGFRGLGFYRNRVLRSGGACFSASRLAEGSVLRDNVFAACNTGARALFGDDSSVVVGAREGAVRFDANVIAGTRGRAIVFRDDGPAGIGAPHIDASEVAVTSIGGNAIGVEPSVDLTIADVDAQVRLARWRLTGFAWMFNLVQPDPASPSVALVDVHGPLATVDIADSSWDAPHITRPASGGFDGATTVRSGRGPVAPVVFEDFMDSSIDLLGLEQWHATAFRPVMEARTFPLDAVVMHRGHLYRSTDTTTSTDVPGASDRWTLLPASSDDVTFAADSPYDGWGVDP